MPALYQLIRANTHDRAQDGPSWNLDGDPRFNPSAGAYSTPSMAPLIGAFVLDRQEKITRIRSPGSTHYLLGWSFGQTAFRYLCEVETCAEAALLLDTGVLVDLGSSDTCYLVLRGAFEASLEGPYRPATSWYWAVLGTPEQGKDWPCPAA